MNKRLITICTAFICACQPHPSAPPLEESEWYPGGGMTAKRLSDRSFIEPGKDVDRMTQLDFWTGFSLFRDPWVIAPSSTADRDGLGPLFNTRSCISCHLSGARGEMPSTKRAKPSALVIKLGNADMKIDPTYGDQIQTRVISATPVSVGKFSAEAQLNLEYKFITGKFADGEPYELRKPMNQLRDLAYGNLTSGVGLSARLAPSVYGVGLLDAIHDRDLLEQADPDDSNGDGISARYNLVPNILSGKKEIGRFGLKAKHPNLVQQVAAAFRDDIGITNELFTSETCTSSQIKCIQASKLTSNGKVELPNKLRTLVNQFTMNIAVPPARKLTSKKVQQGRNLFYRAGCESCHTASYVTDKNYPVPHLAGQKIWPYTNLALHDMGDGLADDVAEYDASGREWRTPPLWGIGLQKKYRKNATYLHDGRARTLEEAILWHGGEARTSQKKFIHFNRTERQALIAFLEAI